MQAAVRMNKITILLFAVVVALGVQTGIAIKCYVCNSGAEYDGTKCADADKQFIQDCDTLQDDIGRAKHNYTFCRKFVQDVEGDVRIVRSCATKGRGRCIDRTGTAKIKLQYCECTNTDPEHPCNDSPRVSDVSPLAVLAGSALVLLSMLHHP